MPIEEMVRIEDKVDLSNCPIPNRSYKIHRALLPSLEKFIVEMKNAGWIEDSTSEFCMTRTNELSPLAWSLVMPINPNATFIANGLR